MADITRNITDPLGLVDIVPKVFLPSIDGATAPPGITVIHPTGDPIPISLPSIDGASPPPGVNVYTATEQAAIAAGAQVYATLHNAAGTKIADLTDLVQVEWQDVWNEPGVGTLTLNRHDADAALVAIGTRVRCYLYGEWVWTWVVDEAPQVQTYDPNDEASELVVARGSGVIGRTSRALVLSPRGLTDPLLPAHRLYSFASPDFPNQVGWGNAVQTYQQPTDVGSRRIQVEWTTLLTGEPDITEYVLTPAPLEWPDPAAYWIWGQADTTVLGFNFFRRTLTITQDTQVAFCVTGDNLYTFYLDGTPILGVNDETAPTWSEYRRIDIPLKAGTYQLAAEVENIAYGAGPYNPAGFLMTCFIPDANGDPGTILCRSDSSWKALAYPTVWPGWTPGQILVDMINEIAARGGLGSFTYDFTATADSAGNAWTPIEGFSIPVGASILDALDALVEQGWIWYRTAPGGQTLQVFRADWEPQVAVTLQATGVEATTNLVSLAFEPQGSPRTRVIAKWSNGQIQLDDAAAQAVYGIEEFYATVEGATAVEATRRAQVILDEIKAPRDAIVAQIDPIGPSERPYRSFQVGDKITVPTRAGGTNPEKLMSISVSHDEEGSPDIRVELQTRVLRVARERDDLLRNLGRGVVGNRKIRQSLYETGGTAR